jgi:uncharacterized protein
MEKTEAVGMACPVCHVDLVMSERHGVEVDYCPKCRGVWLDRGELDKIVEKAMASATPAPQSQPQPASFLPAADANAAPWGGYPNAQPRYREDRDWGDRRESHDHDHGRDHDRRDGRRGGWFDRLLD